MGASDAEAAPTHGPEHEALAVFLGEWEANGTSYGGTDQTGDDPKSNGVLWESTHTGRWHTGEFFLVQNEKACPGGEPFDTLSVMGFDSTLGYFARCFENHGFYRRYDVIVERDRWELSGDHERATIVFSDSNRTQTIVWEWKPEAAWLPLCDRIATRID